MSLNDVDFLKGSLSLTKNSLNPTFKPTAPKRVAASSTLNVMKTLSTLLLCIFFISIPWQTLLAGEPLPQFEFDRALAVDLAKVYLHAQFRAHPERELENLNWAYPYVSTSTTKDGRNLIFVGFRSGETNSGATIIFESYTTTSFLIPNSAGVQSNFIESYNFSGDLAALINDTPSGRRITGRSNHSPRSLGPC